jgi:hypothetical protein
MRGVRCFPHNLSRMTKKSLHKSHNLGAKKKKKKGQSKGQNNMATLVSFDFFFLLFFTGKFAGTLAGDGQLMAAAAC